VIPGASPCASARPELVSPQPHPGDPHDHNYPPLLRSIGLAELAGALGLLPSLTRIRPNLTPLAALGLIAVMVLAIPFHLSRGEAMMLPMNPILAVLAGIIAWGCTRKAPLQAR
jgi:putative oxidoreductase